MQNSKIEWCDHTFNPWWGCQRVSPGCEHCYAETLAHRYNHRVWGPPKTTERREMSANYWKQPIKWNDAARKAETRARVFCASMADVFEDHPQVIKPRWDLIRLIEATPFLDWLLLTKRPENIRRLGSEYWWRHGFPPNIWIGTSVEDQCRADERIPHLLRVPARVRFLSCEPLLGPVDLSPWMEQEYEPVGDGPNVVGAELVSRLPGIHWVIAGGESGHGARPMHPGWARLLRDQCRDTSTPYFFKQWGQFAPPGLYSSGELAFEDGQRMRSVGKHAAGRLLDGVEHNAYPA